MPPDVRKHWRDPRYWQWWWRDAVRGETKFALAVLAALGALVVGFLGADGLTPDEKQATFTTKRLVTIVRTLGGNGSTNDGLVSGVPQVITTSETVTQPPETGLVTVRGKGRTVVVRRPGERVVVTRAGETVTRVVTVRSRDGVVTDTRTDTVVLTATTDRVVTVTAPSATQTVTRDVTGPTVTETQVETVTQPFIVTREITVADLITLTVTLPP